MTQWPATIEQYMTPSPHSIGVEQTLATAEDMMREHGFRHLPVLHGGELVGILSARDLELVEALPDVDRSRVRVEEAMSPVPYTVEPDTELRQVAREMAERKLGSAVVMHGTRVIGVFTTTDALRALTDALDKAR